MKSRNNKNDQSIAHKISRKMTLQASLIAVVAVLAIAFSSIILEQFLVREALNREAIHFWKGYAKDSEFQLPNTDNLKGYLLDADDSIGLPEQLQGYGLGYHKIHGQTEHSLLFVSQQGEKRLHLLFDGESVMRLAIFFGVLPLTIILILIYITAWWVYRESNKLLSPIIWLSNKFDQVDPSNTEIATIDFNDVPGDVDWEVDKLIKSFESYSNRIRNFVERERAFTRDASHEFRTPLTVMKMASQMLLAEPDLNKYSVKYAKKINDSVSDMQALIDAFLVLARETHNEFDREEVDVVELVRSEVASASIYAEDKPVNIRIDNQFPLVLNTAKQVLSIVLGNLIRNAVLYTEEGEVVISIRSASVVVSDSGIGMSSNQIERIFQPYYRADSSVDDGKTSSTSRKGYGVGLTIVKRLSNRFNWILDVKSEIDIGTTIVVNFN